MTQDTLVARIQRYEGSLKRIVDAADRQHLHPQHLLYTLFSVFTVWVHLVPGEQEELTGKRTARAQISRWRWDKVGQNEKHYSPQNELATVNSKWNGAGNVYGPVQWKWEWTVSEVHLMHSLYRQRRASVGGLTHLSYGDVFYSILTYLLSWWFRNMKPEIIKWISPFQQSLCSFMMNVG